MVVTAPNPFTLGLLERRPADLQATEEYARLRKLEPVRDFTLDEIPALGRPRFAAVVSADETVRMADEASAYACERAAERYAE